MDSYFIIYLNILFGFVIVSGVGADDERCCELINHDQQCYIACLEIMNSELSEFDRKIALASHCADIMEELYECILNISSNFATGEAGPWYGRHCCLHTASPNCYSSCRRARSRDDLNSCRPGSEILFFQCLEKQEKKDECCGWSPRPCRDPCLAVFIQQESPSQLQLSEVRNSCPANITSCVQEYAQEILPEDTSLDVPCCDVALTSQCKASCLRAFTSLQSQEEIIQTLTNTCGTISVMNPLWECLLRSATNSLRPGDSHGASMHTTGMDAAKLHCCARGRSNRCRELCVQTHGREFATSWEQFENRCLYRTTEKDLNVCLDEVDEPCRLGCDGLQYCTNFNHRPAEMFRSCSRDAEVMAEKTLNIWAAERIISLPLLADIPVRDVIRCQPSAWKTLACALSVKPCKGDSSVLSICYTDCVKVLSECVDRARLQPGVTVYRMCAILAPDKDVPCLSPLHYMDRSIQIYTEEITHPCIPNPCNASDVCVIRQRKCHHSDSQQCKPYVCTPGCQLGEVSKFHAITHELVRLPAATVSEKQCHRVCECGHDGLLHGCHDAGCLGRAHCLLDNGSIQEHGVHFSLGCNRCVCVDGHVTCTRRLCYDNPSGLPCGCESDYKPITAANGHTYHNLCLARCLSANHGTKGDLEVSDINLCSGVECPVSHNCIPRRRVCLYPENCSQYVCEPIAGHCNSHEHRPVCDTDGVEHINLCRLWQHNKLLAYWGHCQTGCRMNGPVCGLDSYTYTNECHAWASGVPADYVGRCRSTPQRSNFSTSSAGIVEYRCTNVECPKPAVNSKMCRSIVPTGGCCPICGSEIRVLYSHHLIGNSLKSRDSHALSMEQMLKILTYQLTTAECKLMGYLGLEGDMILILLPVKSHTTASYLQLEACTHEAYQLTSNINMQTASLASYVMTSSLVSAQLRSSEFAQGQRSSGVSHVIRGHVVGWEGLNKSAFHFVFSSILVIVLVRVWTNPIDFR